MSDQPENKQTALSNVHAGRDIHIGAINQNINLQAPAEKLSEEERFQRRQRDTLLRKVKRMWIEGIKSIHTQPIIELGLEDVSYLVTLSNEDYKEQKKTKVFHNPGKSVTEVFNERRTLLILGEPGAGKTTALLKLADDLIDRDKENESSPIPVVFNLSSWGIKQQTIKQQTIADWLVQELWDNYQVPKKVSEDWIEKQQLLLLLDGLDEVRANRQEDCVEAINAFIQKHGQTDMVICCHIRDYKVLPNHLQLLNAINICSLTPEQVNIYLDETDSANDEQLGAVKTLLEGDAIMQELAKSPLMLSVMVETYQGKKVGELPQMGSEEERREDLFKNYIDRMFDNDGMARKFGLKKAKKKYEKDQAIHWLTCLAQQMPQSIFKIEGIQPQWLPLEKDIIIYLLVTGLILGVIFGLMVGLYFIFYFTITHDGKPIPEINYFIKSIMIGILSVLIPGLISGLLCLRFNGLKRVLISMSILAISIFFFYYIFDINKLSNFAKISPFIVTPTLLCAIFGGFIFSSIDKEIKPVMMIEWSLKKILKNVVVFTFFGLILALMQYQIMPELINGHSKFNYSIFIIIIFILIGIFKGGFSIQKLEIDPKEAKPNEGIIRSLKHMVIYFITSFIFAVIASFIMDFSYILNPALIIIGLVCGLLGGLGLSGSPGVVCIQHFTLRIILHCKNYMPLNYVHFLEYATRLNFLRKGGGSYIFFHPMLQDHFADMKD